MCSISLRFVFAGVALIVLTYGSAKAETVYGITDTATPSLVFFDGATPGTLTTVGPISGLVAGHTLRGIDFRPSNGLLYALSNSGATADAQLYTIDLASGALTTVGSGLTLAGNTSPRISLDFNPVVDALRVVTGSAQNYRVNPNSGALIAQDTSITPNDLPAGIAYSDNTVGASSTTLYAYNFNTDAIGTIGSIGGTPTSPNTGQFNLIGSSGVLAFSLALGFDVSGATGVAYLSLDDANSPDANTEWYTANLGTGAISFIGDFNTPLLDISVQPVPEPTTLALATAGVMALAFIAGRRR